MIPGVTTYHPRESWEPWAMPYTVASLRPPPQRSEWITQPVAHYTAADDLIDGDPGEHADDLPAYLGAIQRDYARNRGYSIGYLFAIDWLGGVWELRGFDYKSAANAGHNEYTAPILFLVDGADPVTAEAAASARAVWREFRRRSNRADFKQRPLGHGQLYETTKVGTPTACPGAGILGQLNAGFLDLDADRPPPTTPEDDMAKMTVINVRWDGYADVVTGFHSSQETMRNNGLDPADYVLLPKPTAAKRAEIEAQLGHKLTPYSG